MINLQKERTISNTFKKAQLEEYWKNKKKKSVWSEEGEKAVFMKNRFWSTFVISFLSILLVNFMKAVRTLNFPVFVGGEGGKVWVEKKWIFKVWDFIVETSLAGWTVTGC